MADADDDADFEGQDFGGDDDFDDDVEGGNVFLPMRLVVPVDAETFVPLLPEGLKLVLRDQLGQLRDRLLRSSDDPALRRLFPTAYLDDEKKDREYQELMRDDLLASRLSSIEVLEQSLDARELNQAQLGDWMRAVNAVRLLLGTLLDVSEEPEDIDDDDPDALAHQIYDVLGAIVNDIVLAMRAAGTFG